MRQTEVIILTATPLLWGSAALQKDNRVTWRSEKSARFRRQKNHSSVKSCSAVFSSCSRGVSSNGQARQNVAPLAAPVWPIDGMNPPKAKRGQS
ncbi:unnamed protein product [Pleuronectes platessa]|uniref:Uncharacterized protein n=1 Tax=Pleuronectes platessa TaxID=8262 RepID=A0A9N7TIR2_PLEPL|nr:unnamed protein product [Pleuronectes platessa]